MSVGKNWIDTPSPDSDFPDPTRLHFDAYVYMAGALFFAIILTILFALNYMWCECCCDGSRKIRAKCKEYDSQFHNSLALMENSARESVKEKF